MTTIKENSVNGELNGAAAEDAQSTLLNESAEGVAETVAGEAAGIVTEPEAEPKEVAETPAGAPEPAAGEPEQGPEAGLEGAIVPEPEPEPAPAQPEPESEAPAESEPAETAKPKEKVDFSDEEAELAAQASDMDLGDDDDDHDENGGKPGISDNDLLLASKSKAELVGLFATLLEEKPIQELRRDAEAIKVAFYKLLRAEIEAERKAFAESGGDPESFEAPVDEQELRLKDLVNEYRHRRDKFIANLERDKEENLKAKLEIIEELKSLVNGSETLGQTFNSFRELQQRWRDTGPVPQANVKDLWETYNHHVENFYSYIKINKELRDLDLKRNYEAKLALCEEAEALVLEPSIVTAFHKLQKLHDEWRETGPVANEYKEAVWERFREASSRINKQHQQYFDDIKEEQRTNLELKTRLCEQTEALAAEPYTTRKEWNKASDKLLEIQKVWKTIGFAPRKNNTKIYERFRNACDSFFEAKRNFYSQLKIEMELNLQLKNEICELAESMRESGEWKKTSDELIVLQKRWKEIGPVPRRYSDSVWKRFRAACDHFFERKNAHFADVEGDYKDNLERKRALLAEAAEKGFEGISFEDIKDFQRRWSEIGFVPIKQKDAIQKQYRELVDKMFATLRGGERERSMDKFRNRVTNLKGSGDKRLRFERERLYNKVKQLESDIATLENNIGFFGTSKNAEAMIAEVRDKIERAKAEMATTIEKIQLIDAENE